MNAKELEQLRTLECEIECRLHRMHAFEAGEEEIVALAARLAAVNLAEHMRSGEAITDERLLTAGEAEAYYQYCLYRDTQAELSEFTAGDVSYVLAENRVEKARSRRDQALALASALLKDPEEFCFRRV